MSRICVLTNQEIADYRTTGKKPDHREHRDRHVSRTVALRRVYSGEATLILDMPWAIHMEVKMWRSKQSGWGGPDVLQRIVEK
jgi:hypothetical protein